MPQGPCIRTFPRADPRHIKERACQRPRAAHLATLTYLPSTTLRMALEPAPSLFSSIGSSPATPGKFLRLARQPRILSRSASRSPELLVTPDASMQCL